MKTITAITLILLTFLGYSCQQDPSDQNKNELPSITNKTVEFSGTKIASPMIYEVLIQNPDTTNDWESEKLENLNTEALVEIVFEAVYEEKVKAFNYHTGEVMSVDEIKAMESQEGFERKYIGKVQFVEDWYVNKENLQISKDVHSILLAYEVYDSFGTVIGYKAAFVVHMK